MGSILSSRALNHYYLRTVGRYQEPGRPQRTAHCGRPGRWSLQAKHKYGQPSLESPPRMQTTLILSSYKGIFMQKIKIIKFWFLTSYCELGQGQCDLGLDGRLENPNECKPLINNIRLS
ncbi:hypothetical protein AVEN_179601-1 [Araneus ventricosus]|uniref:Uncharacterized protein n=1 Tax=Araneus ventricosus TaxID=182803 RepID=A0A4Y2BEU7_ARAVE|nr:hypothetical protein AVEN_179601-1 [Araneus ventricosus]